MESAIDEIRKQLGSKNMIIGEREVQKGILKGTIKKVYLAKNCKVQVRRDIEKSREIAGFDLEVVSLQNEELGILCKKPFSVSVIGVI